MHVLGKTESSKRRPSDGPTEEIGDGKRWQDEDPEPKAKVPIQTGVRMKTQPPCSDLYAIADRPYREANGLLSKVDPERIKACFGAIYPNLGTTFMHASDHHAALLILLDREPTYREVQDSAHLQGSKNIEAARKKVGGGLRPTGWDEWNESQRKQAVLTELYGIARGGRIADGKAKDPTPERTKAFMRLWGMTVPEEPPVEKPPEPPDKPPEKPVEKPPPEKPGALSPAGQRAEEVMTILLPIFAFKDESTSGLRAVLRPILIEIIEAKRRAEERIVARVVEEMKKK
jgi:hypothetical protein